MRLRYGIAALLMMLAEPVAAQQIQAAAQQIQVVQDGIPLALGGFAGDAQRGRAIVADRQKGLCLLCHNGPFPEQRFQGNLAPSLAGAGARWNVAQLRLRIADSRRLNPATLMPSYYRTDDLVLVGKAWAGRPVLNEQEIEDVVAFLATLRD
ncbi:sulfur oxidation c-type cytochrome SoxX [Ferrovibrio sp.]|uniref:sulfur oxidation c-type cytochrome SoxX n=1 Tax=Ferrovibrio sp. TaxID=1917215 RepID=UPI001B4E6366|nr:sulfur oxidation c-type cytochrome SoxX [Ferrovibrio sp.]MBP7063311.1 sulfur oxidation c-type cytochrome SoxX [Ferrovibrio sp.]